ncbi:MAG TPA: 30S ribosomal protein S16 [Catalimonadaceae bacterium]|jgi:small subunit ribosomal protein S16|nr:30S ribosomal protein S16 [Catalimonadaceae bacterium]
MVKIRLARRGRKKLALFDVIVANVTAPRDGRFIEKIGTYNPNTIPATIVLDEAKALKWLMNGAQPTDTTRAILSYRGVMYKKHLQVGVNKGAISQEAADAKYEAWKEGKESKISGRVDSLAKAKVDAAKARLEAETKVNAARATAQQEKLAAELKAANPEPEVVVEEAPVAIAPEEVVAEAAPIADNQEVVADEAPAAEPTAEVATEETKTEAES